MKFLADECCEASLVESLRAHGYDIYYVLESMRGAEDAEVLNFAFREKRILLTEDKDFGELVFRLNYSLFGLVLLRFSIEDRDKKITQLVNLINKYSNRMQGSFIVLEADKIRIRPIE